MMISFWLALNTKLNGLGCTHCFFPLLWPRLCPVRRRRSSCLCGAEVKPREMCACFLRVPFQFGFKGKHQPNGTKVALPLTLGCWRTTSRLTHGKGALVQQPARGSPVSNSTAMTAGHVWLVCSRVASGLILDENSHRDVRS